MQEGTALTHRKIPSHMLQRMLSQPPFFTMAAPQCGQHLYSVGIVRMAKLVSVDRFRHAKEVIESRHQTLQLQSPAKRASM